jgi:hypothetical protein
MWSIRISFRREGLVGSGVFAKRSSNEMGTTIASPSQPNTAGKAAWICLIIAWVGFLAPLPGTSWIIGWPLNLVAFVLAIVVIARAGARAGIFPLLSSLIISPIVYFIGLALFAGGVAATAEAVDAQSDRSPEVRAAQMEQTHIESEKEEAEAGSLTGQQKNAARSAKQYLRLTGFSRDGLIQQLSSEAGNGYSVADATAAVDSLNVDWNQEAVESAKQYLSMQGFSCKGLIQQLSSSAGHKFTVSQATYGAQQAGACN